MKTATERKHWWQSARRCGQCGLPLGGLRRPFEGDSFCSDQCAEDDSGSRAW